MQCRSFTDDPDAPGCCIACGDAREAHAGRVTVTSSGQVFRSTRDVLFANTDGPGGSPALPNNLRHE
jgi:hypothetical protein